MGVSSAFALFIAASVCCVAAPASAASSTVGVEIYSGSSCAGTPNAITMFEMDTDCVDGGCYETDLGNDTYYLTLLCNISDRYAKVQEIFGDFNYMILEIYNVAGCESLNETDTFPASGSCEVASSSGNVSLIASLYGNGSATVSYYYDSACSVDADSYVFELDSSDISSGACIDDYYKFYTRDTISSLSSGSSSTSSSGLGTSDDGGLSTGAIVGIVIAGVVLLLLVIGLAIWCSRAKKQREDRPVGTVASASGNDWNHDVYSSIAAPMSGKKGTVTGLTTDEPSLEDGEGPRGLGGLWDDETITTARIPREKVLVQRLISRGGYGEVCFGLFNGHPVAVKTLLPNTRKSVKHVNAFLAEVKLMATLDHPRIVQFLGVAWDSLTDLCVVSEYMEGGDLRALLVSYVGENYPVGFDRTKATIALHVAHALTYLHSLAPPVLHRDLKSKNILLSPSLDAKLTDFGISRERVDKTMTAGVGTSLWMAPEVMLGERYDDKADVFSFGVVLSEMDLHTLPYAHAKEKGDSGRQVPDTAILQMVALGKLRVEFSPIGPESIVTLGRTCVSVDPKERPTAAEALYRLQTILAREL
ncbi:hypothetical protein BBJ28_00011579 [Nothophytophthora sp. Chile5]|nr:hypothetical protein BBJ28_00011579 [Nothophytophthora sp. Chile5]